MLQERYGWPRKTLSRPIRLHSKVLFGDFTQQSQKKITAPAYFQKLTKKKSSNVFRL